MKCAGSFAVNRCKIRGEWPPARRQVILVKRVNRRPDRIHLCFEESHENRSLRLAVGPAGCQHCRGCRAGGRLGRLPPSNWLSCFAIIGSSRSLRIRCLPRRWATIGSTIVCRARRWPIRIAGSKRKRPLWPACARFRATSFARRSDQLRLLSARCARDSIAEYEFRAPPDADHQSLGVSYFVSRVASRPAAGERSRLRQLRRTAEGL